MWPKCTFCFVGLRKISLYLVKKNFVTKILVPNGWIWFQILLCVFICVANVVSNFSWCPISTSFFDRVWDDNTSNSMLSTSFYPNITSQVYGSKNIVLTIDILCRILAVKQYVSLYWKWGKNNEKTSSIENRLTSVTCIII